MFKDTHDIATDLNDVVWRVPRKGDGVRVKVRDPNFVHESEPLPTIRLFDRDVDAIGVGILIVAALMLFLLGTLA